MNRNLGNNIEGIEWRCNSRAIDALEKFVGKSAILSTDSSLPAEEIVKMYLGMIVPVRHRL